MTESDNGSAESGQPALPTRKPSRPGRERQEANLAPQWKKGQSGNPKGKPRKLPRLDELLANVLGAEDAKGITEAEKVLNALRAKAKKGSTTAAEALLDRAYGKPKQTTELTGAGGEPLIPARVELVLVRPKDPAE